MIGLYKSIYIQWLLCVLSFCIVILFFVIRYGHVKCFSLKRKIILGIFLLLSILLMADSFYSFNYALKLLRGGIAVQPSYDVFAVWCDWEARFAANLTIALNVLAVCIIIFKKEKPRNNK
jgi:hypothetical protein